jgi:tripartite ATP-independent transporter DctP family solute receptor
MQCFFDLYERKGTDMTLKFRNRCVAAIAATACVFGLAGQASGAEWRLSSMMTDNSIEGQGYTMFASLAEKYTNGAVKIRVYPNEQLGKMDAVVEQVSAGVIHIAPSSASFLSKWEPEIKFIGAPFIFKDYAHWAKFMNSPLVASWLASVENKAGIMVLGKISDFPRGSGRVILSRTPVNSIGDLKGLKVRQFQDPLIVESWRHLGAEVRVMAWGEVYDGINRRIIDAVTSPLELVASSKFYEVAPYVTWTEEYPQGVAFMMNAKAFKALTPDQQAGLRKAHEEASAFVRAQIKDYLADFSKKLPSDKIVFKTDMDLKPFVARMAEFYAAQDKAGKLPKGFLAAVDAAHK